MKTPTRGGGGNAARRETRWTSTTTRTERRSRARCTRGTAFCSAIRTSASCSVFSAPRRAAAAAESKAKNAEDALEEKSAESEAFMAEMEAIGAAYEEAQTENARLMSRLTERDGTEQQAMTEKVQAQALARKLREEKAGLEAAVAHERGAAVAAQRRVHDGRRNAAVAAAGRAPRPIVHRDRRRGAANVHEHALRRRRYRRPRECVFLRGRPQRRRRLRGRSARGGAEDAAAAPARRAEATGAADAVRDRGG
mmetsp:Transcript_6448/g.23642  ORF Transcript_6448/g.23642 Transcript_6448/m.23642 type:complete len:253 (-) Transcript_6448:1387-2145(-)